MKLFYKIIRSFFNFLFKIFYRHQVYGLEHFPKGPAIIAPNHVSFFDPPLVGVSCPEELSFLAKDTLFKQPCLGTIIRNLNAHPVAGKMSDLSSLKVVLKLLKEQKKVIIFPEGIRSYDGLLTKVKPGICMLAIRAQVPIIPTFIHGTYEIWPRQNRFPKPWGHTVCIFGKPIYPEEFSHLDKKEAQEKMAAKISSSIESLRLWHEQGCQGHPPSMELLQ